MHRWVPGTRVPSLWTGANSAEAESCLALRHVKEGQNLQCFPFFNTVNSSSAYTSVASWGGGAWRCLCVPLVSCLGNIIALVALWEKCLQCSCSCWCYCSCWSWSCSCYSGRRCRLSFSLVTWYQFDVVLTRLLLQLSDLLEKSLPAGANPEICIGCRPFSFLHVVSPLFPPILFFPLPPLSFFSPSPPLPLRSRVPLNQIQGLGSTAGFGAEPRPKTNLVHSRAVRNPLVGIILSTEVHVSRQNDQNLALTLIQYRFHLSGVPWGRRSVAQRGRRPEPVWPPLNPPLTRMTCNVSS